MYVCDGRVRFFRHPWALVLYAKVVSASTAKTSARRVSPLSKKPPAPLQEKPPAHFKVTLSWLVDQTPSDRTTTDRVETPAHNIHPPSYRHHHQPAWQFISPHTHYSITPLAVSNKSLAVISRLSKMGGRRFYINRRRTPYRRWTRRKNCERKVVPLVKNAGKNCKQRTLQGQHAESWIIAVDARQSREQNWKQITLRRQMKYWKLVVDARQSWKSWPLASWPWGVSTSAVFTCTSSSP